MFVFFRFLFFSLLVPLLDYIQSDKFTMVIAQVFYSSDRWSDKICWVVILIHFIYTIEHETD